jgi:hypothetical protein
MARVNREIAAISDIEDLTKGGRAVEAGRHNQSTEPSLLTNAARSA